MDSGERDAQGQAAVTRKVLDHGLCTGCAACVNLCPYMVYFKDNTIVLHHCDQEAGRCHSYCPRTPTDLEGLRRALFDPADMTPEVGAFKGLYITRAADESIRARAQHGGTVTALIQLAIDEGVIDEAVLSDQNEQFLPNAETVRKSSDAIDRGKSKFVVSPTVCAFNEASKGDAAKIGVVATPCQALALSNMKVNPLLGDETRTEKLALVIGLFCGWALDWRKFKRLLQDKVRDVTVEGVDIPPSKHACMEVYTDAGTLEIPIDEVNECVRESCDYCFDMTCEYADLSVGSARSRDGWEVDKGWNQVIVRTALGEKLLKLAESIGVLEFKAVPEGNIERLKKASANKKRTCIENLKKLTGDAHDLRYLDTDDPVVRIFSVE
jgi:coenzyme F420 hydrogenase subunit beta